jgi:hypothetical protein
MFKILSGSGELLNVITIDKPIDALSSNFEYSPERIYFTEPYVTEKYIYVMWINRQKQDVEADFENFKPELMIFDWNGNPVKRYALNQPIITFAVVEDLKKLYGVSFFENDINTIYEYDLPEIAEGKYRKTGNQFYTIEVPEYLDYLRKAELNEIVPYNGYLLNGNFLGQGLEGKDKNLGATTLCVYFKPDKNLVLAEELDNLLTRHVGEDMKTEKVVVNDRETMRLSYTVHTKDYNNNSDTLYCNVFFFEQNGEIIEMKVYTKTPDFDKYYADFLHIIASFSVIGKSV